MITSAAMNKEIQLHEKFRERVRKQVADKLKDRNVRAVSRNVGMSHVTVHNVSNPELKSTLNTLLRLVEYFEANP